MENIELELKTEWPDSYLADEARVFLQSIPSINYSAAESAISHVEKQSRLEVVESLSKIVPSDVLGLLNISLLTRYFHPEAVAANPNPSSVARLGSWHAKVSSTIHKLNFSSINHKILSASSMFPSPIERISFLKELEFNFSKFEESISAFNISDSEVNNLPPINHSPLSTVNGRVCKSDILSIVDCAISERKKMNAFIKYFSLSREFATKFFSTMPFYEPWHYTRQPEPDLGTTLFNSTSKKAPASNFQTSGHVLTFLDCGLNLVEINLFVSLTSPESLPLLQFSFDIEKGERPFSVKIFLLTQKGNETEEQIASAFYSLLQNEGSRSAALFLFEGIKGGFRKAYERAMPNKPWKKVKDIETMKKVNKMLEYAIENGIKGAAASINGHFIKERPVFSYVKAASLNYGRSIMNYAVSQKLSASEDWKSWIKDRTIKIQRSQPPLSISDMNYASFDGFSEKELITVTTDLSKGDIKAVTSSPVVVAFVDYGWQINGNFSSICVNSSVFSKSTAKFLRFHGPTTVVGPLIFHARLSEEELDYAIQFCSQVFCDGEFPSSIAARIFAFLCRGDDRLKRIKRRGPSNLHPLSVGESPLVWRIEADPLSPSFQETISSIDKVIQTSAMKVEFVPLFSKSSINEVPSHFFTQYFDASEEGTISLPKHAENVEFPDTWAVVSHEPYKYIVTGVASSGFCPGTSIIRIGGKTVIPKDGYFMICLPLGKHDSYSIGSFKLSTKFYDMKTENCSDDRIHVLTSYDSPHFNESISSLLTLSKSRFYIHILSSSAVILPKALSAEIIPKVPPFFASDIWEVSSDWNWIKICLSALYVPYKTIVFDSNVVWQGDASALSMLQLEDCVIAAPEMASMGGGRGKGYMAAEKVSARFGRPYLNSAVFYANFPHFLKVGGVEEACEVLRTIISEESFSGQIGDQLLSLIQLRVQVLVLDDKANYRPGENNNDRTKALSVSLSDSDSEKKMAVQVDNFRKKYEVIWHNEL